MVDHAFYAYSTIRFETEIFGREVGHSDLKTFKRTETVDSEKTDTNNKP